MLKVEFLFTFFLDVSNRIFPFYVIKYSIKKSTNNSKVQKGDGTFSYILSCLFFYLSPLTFIQKEKKELLVFYLELLNSFKMIFLYAFCFHFSIIYIPLQKNIQIVFVSLNNHSFNESNRSIGNPKTSFPK